MHLAKPWRTELLRARPKHTSPPGERKQLLPLSEWRASYGAYRGVLGVQACTPHVQRRGPAAALCSGWS